MTLNNTLKTGKAEGTETVTFYHVSTEVAAFKSFFREGAKAIGKGVGGQVDGFYVWTNEKAAEDHIRFLHEDPFADKVLKNNEAIIIGVSVPKESLSYPVWQQDYEKNSGLFDLCVLHAECLKNKAHNLNIPIPEQDRPLGWNFDKITDLSYNEEGKYFLFEGVDKKEKKWRKRFSDSSFWDAEDSIKWQILTDWFCQNNPDFKKDYNNLMQKICSDGKISALKYTGTEPLAITKAEYVKVNADGSIKKTPVLNTSKGKNQVCPFLTLIQTRKEK